MKRTGEAVNWFASGFATAAFLFLAVLQAPAWTWLLLLACAVANGGVAWRAEHERRVARRELLARMHDRSFGHSAVLGLPPILPPDEEETP